MEDTEIIDLYFARSEDAIRETALAAIADVLGGKEPRKVIVVKGRLVNVVA